jgi:hypothetical protein
VLYQELKRRLFFWSDAGVRGFGNCTKYYRILKLLADTLKIFQRVLDLIGNRAPMLLGVHTWT